MVLGNYYSQQPVRFSCYPTYWECVGAQLQLQKYHFLRLLFDDTIALIVV